MLILFYLNKQEYANEFEKAKRLFNEAFERILINTKWYILYPIICS